MTTSNDTRAPAPNDELRDSLSAELMAMRSRVPAANTTFHYLLALTIIEAEQVWCDTATTPVR